MNDLTKLPAGKRTPTTTENQHSTSTSLGNRQYRPDLMAHYPFADNSGSVTDVLHVANSDLQKLLDMGEPACKRLVLKIFEEMRFSKVGLKMSDVPEALNVSLILCVSMKNDTLLILCSCFDKTAPGPDCIPSPTQNPGAHGSIHLPSQHIPQQETHTQLLRRFCVYSEFPHPRAVLPGGKTSYLPLPMREEP